MKADLERQALTKAELLADTYAQQVGHTIGEIDHVTALLKHYWESSGGSLRLEALQRDSHFINTALMGASIADAQGRLITSTLSNAAGMSVWDRNYFKFHLYLPSTRMYIGSVVAGRLKDKEIVTFSRRLSRPDGGFAGVLTVSTGTRFLASFGDSSILGETGILALVSVDGGLQAAKIGDDIESLLNPKVLTKPSLNYRPSFHGLSDPTWFNDGKARYLASKPVPGYPVYAVVGLAQDEVLAPFHATRTSYVQLAVAGILGLILFAAVSLVMSYRLAWKKHAEERARKTYRLATEGANEGFYLWRPVFDAGRALEDFELVDCNERGARFIGGQRAGILNRRLSQMFNVGKLDELMRLAQSIMASGYHEDEVEIPGPDAGAAAWVNRKFVYDGDGIAVTLRDITVRKRLELEKALLAEQDSLTKLPNRNWLAAHLPPSLAQAGAEGKNVAILFVDLDKFKIVNDTWGHSTGDQLLHAVANRVRGVIRPGDRMARFGGDEFIVVLEGISHEAGIIDAARRIADALALPFTVAQREWTIGASIGISVYPRDGQDAETLIKHADIAMYMAKARGKGQFCFFENDYFARMQQAQDLERELALALQHDQFVVHYQPRVDARSGRLAGMEALIRWKHPERGLVFPNHFIPAAESSGLIVALGDVVMEKVCRQLAQWCVDGVPLVPVSVNVSARQFNEAKVVSVLSGLLARHRLPAALVDIELTESTMVDNAQAVSDELTALHAMGTTVHLDDFGTGYSSLSVLHGLDVDVLKVDRAFTAQLAAGSEAEILYKAIISMAKALGMRVIAEGVETEQQLRLLQQLGCDEIQGYFISKPLAPEQMRDFMQSHAGFAQQALGLQDA